MSTKFEFFSHFAFDDMIFVLIVPDPDHCLLFAFITTLYIILTNSSCDMFVARIKTLTAIIAIRYEVYKHNSVI